MIQRTDGLRLRTGVFSSLFVKLYFQRISESHPCRHQDIRVEDVMTPWAQLRMLDYYQVTVASARRLGDQFRGTDTTHVLVIGRAAVGTGQVRGLISRGQLLRLFGPQNAEPRGITH